MRSKNILRICTENRFFSLSLSISLMLVLIDISYLNFSLSSVMLMHAFKI